MIFKLLVCLVEIVMLIYGIDTGNFLPFATYLIGGHIGVYYQKHYIK